MIALTILNAVLFFFTNKRVRLPVRLATAGTMLHSLSGDEQHATIATFIQYELDEAMKKITCYSSKMLDRLTD